MDESVTGGATITKMCSLNDCWVHAGNSALVLFEEYLLRLGGCMSEYLEEIKDGFINPRFIVRLAIVRVPVSTDEDGVTYNRYFAYMVDGSSIRLTEEEYKSISRIIAL